MAFGILKYIKQKWIMPCGNLITDYPKIPYHISTAYISLIRDQIYIVFPLIAETGRSAGQVE
jgi:hypothetical protein